MSLRDFLSNDGTFTIPKLNATKATVSNIVHAVSNGSYTITDTNTGRNLLAFDVNNNPLPSTLYTNINQSINQVSSQNQQNIATLATHTASIASLQSTVSAQQAVITTLNNIISNLNNETTVNTVVSGTTNITGQNIQVAQMTITNTGIVQGNLITPYSAISFYVFFSISGGNAIIKNFLTSGLIDSPEALSFSVSSNQLNFLLFPKELNETYTLVYNNTMTTF